MKILLTTIHSRYTQSSLALPCLFVNLSEKFSPFILEYNINQTAEDIFADIIKSDFDVVAFSCYIWNVEKTLEVAGRIKALRPDVKIILGGPEVSYDAEDLLLKNQFIDFILGGEGEEILPFCLENINNAEILSKTTGINGRIQDRIFKNPPAFVNNLDKINLPYKQSDFFTGKKFTYFESTRGCPFRCAYCLSSLTGKVRFLSMDKVYENLKYLIDCDFEMIRFIDRTFNVDEKRAMKIMQFIMDNRKNNQCFQFEIKADLITSDFIEFIKKAPAGAFQFEIGVQSINPDVIVSLDRKESAEKLFNNIYQITSSGNIHTHLDLIIGLPGETLDSILAGIDKCFLLKPDTLQANTLKLLKGSPLWLKKNDNGLKCSPFAPYEVLESDCMSYDEIVYAEKVSKIINIFYNSGWFKITIQKICENMKFSEFVSKMVSKFDNECINFHSVSRKKLFEILYGFIRENIHSDLHEIVVEGLSVDFILTSKDYKKNFPEFEPVSNISSKKPKIQAEINITPKTMFKLSNSVNKILLKNDFTVESNKIIKDDEDYCYYYFDFEKNSNCWIEDLNQVKILNELSQRKRDFKSLSEIVGCDDECFNNNMNFLREKNIISIL